MACEGLTGLPKVWCQICEAWRDMWEPGTAEDREKYFEYRVGVRDERAAEAANDFSLGWFAQSLRNAEVPEEFVQAMDQIADMPFPSDVLFGSVAFMGWMTATLRGYAGLAQLPIQYQIAGEMGLARPDPNAAWLMNWRGLDSGTRDRYLKDQGWTQTMINSFGEISRPRLSPGDMFRHAHLTGGGIAEPYNEMAARGYTAEDTAAASVLSRFYPGPSDLVRMAVREAWDDGVAGQWGYDQDLSSEFVAEMARQGDTEGWAQKYWRAHWELPGITLGMEMLHRVPEFGISEFQQLLKISDIPSTFRNYISQIAYSDKNFIGTG